MQSRGPRRVLHHLLELTGLHRHRAEPDLSALVAFPACRCGALLWPATGAEPPEQISGQRLTADRPGAPRRTKRRG
jgi:hypothetical protein